MKYSFLFNQGVVRYKTTPPSYVIIQGVYDTYDIVPIKVEAASEVELALQPDARFVFIGMICYKVSKRFRNDYIWVAFIRPQFECWTVEANPIEIHGSFRLIVPKVFLYMQMFLEAS